MKIRPLLKKRQLAFVEKNLAKARANPKKCGLAMKERGLYSPTTNDRDLDMFVRGLIRTIEKKQRIATQTSFKGLFDEAAIKHAENGSEWDRQADDKLLSLYFAGTPPDRIAVMMKRNPKAILRRLEMFKYNERNLADNYRAYRRPSRHGHRLTALDEEFITAHKDRGVDPQVTAGILARNVWSWYKDTKSEVFNSRLKELAPTADLCLAHRYLYWCVKQPIISNEAYDTLKKEELEFGNAESVLLQPASDKNTDYPPHIRSLANYMQMKEWEKKGHPDKMTRKMEHGAVTEYQKKWLKRTKRNETTKD